MNSKTKALKGEKAARMSDNGAPGKKLPVKDEGNTGKFFGTRSSDGMRKLHGYESKK